MNALETENRSRNPTPFYGLSLACLEGERKTSGYALWLAFGLLVE